MQNDKLIKHCPTCGSEIPDFPFKVGDRVRHFHGYEGVVEIVGAAVEVQFDSRDKVGRGIYDRSWFNAWPDGLTKI